MTHSAPAPNPASTRTLVVEREVPHPPEKVWRALTHPPLIEEWLMKNDFEPEVGRRFHFRSTPMPNWNGVIDCEVLVVDPLKQLAYRWSSMGLETVVTWTLTPNGGGTHLRMEQSGFPLEAEANYKGAHYGWQRFIGTLEQVLDGGAGMKPGKGIAAGFWISTALFALQMGFTAYAQLRLPQVAQAFAHLGFPAYFRVELSWAKFAGLAALLLPMVPARIKEWAYAGFAITLVSALIAHFAVGDGFSAWGWAAGTGVLWVASYLFWRRLQAVEDRMQALNPAE